MLRRRFSHEIQSDKSKPQTQSQPDILRENKKKPTWAYDMVIKQQNEMKKKMGAPRKHTQ